MSTPKLDLSEIAESQSDKFLRYNSAIQDIDQLLNPVALGYTATPPGSPANGDMYIVAHGATGDWAGYDDWIAYYLTNTGAWKFKRPYEGWVVYNRGTQTYYRFTEGSAGGWSEAPLALLSASTDVKGMHIWYNGSEWVKSESANLLFEGSQAVTAVSGSEELFRVTIPSGGFCGFEGGFGTVNGSGGFRYQHYRHAWYDDGNSPNTIAAAPIGGAAANNNWRTSFGDEANWAISISQEGNDLVFSGTTSADDVNWKWRVEVLVF